jgi:SAM-dependent methyltransferase
MAGGFDKHYADGQIAVQTNPLRRRVRAHYLRSLVGLAGGAICDFGCGTGALLEYAPTGSFGFDINPHAIRHGLDRGHDVFVWNPEEDGYRMDFLQERPVKALVMNHVLEHLDAPDSALREILNTCSQARLDRVVVVVPGVAGFRRDPTHKVFIDMSFLVKHGMKSCSGFSITERRYFPLPFEIAGRFFPYNELRIVFSRLSQ